MPIDTDATDNGSRFRPGLLGRKYQIIRSAAELGPEFRPKDVGKHYFRDSVVADKVGFRDPQAWSRAKQEERPAGAVVEAVTAHQLQALAAYLRLDAYLGAEAWRNFLDGISVEDFHLLLISSGYGCYGLLTGSEDPILTILKDLNAFTPHLGGVVIETVSSAFRQMYTADEGEELAAAAASTVDLPEWSRVRLHLDLETPAHVVLLDISYAATPRRFKATVLAPSFRARTAPLGAGTPVPTEEEVFVVGPPLERHHLFGFVSERPLPVTWQEKANGFPVMTTAEFDRFVAVVKVLGPGEVRVVHRPYRVVQAA